ncbi:MAG: hypothetical protein AB1458_16430 [Bacteroidota bacterium]
MPAPKLLFFAAFIMAHAGFSQVIFTSTPPQEFERHGDSVIVKRWDSGIPHHVVTLAGKDSAFERFYHKSGGLASCGWQVRFKKSHPFVKSGKWCTYRENGELYEEKFYSKGKLRKTNIFYNNESSVKWYRRIRKNKWDYHLRKIVVRDSSGYTKRKMIYRPSYLRKGMAFASDLIAPPWWGNKRSGREKIKEVHYNRAGQKTKKIRYFCGFKTMEKQWYDNGRLKSDLRCRRGDDVKKKEYYEGGGKKKFAWYDKYGTETTVKEWHGNGRMARKVKQSADQVKREITYDESGRRTRFVKRKGYAEVYIAYWNNGKKRKKERYGMLLRPDKEKEWYKNGKRKEVTIYKQRWGKTIIVTRIWDENGKKTVIRRIKKYGPGPKF